MKIVVLTSETPANVWLVNQLLSRHDIVGIVIERRPLASTPHDKLERRRRMVRRHGLARTINKLLYNQWRSRVLSGSDARIVRESFFPDAAPVEYARPVPTIVVGSVNDAECKAFIGGLAPELLAVCGTSVLKAEVFGLAPKGAINIHTGITPEYRSADPIFWALYRGEPDKVGVTVHHIDSGVDTGAIIHQSAVPVYADDSLATIAVRCIRRGAELYSRALVEIENGTSRTIVRNGVAGNAFLSIDLGFVQYVLFRFRFWRLRSRLPSGMATDTFSAEALR